MEKGHFENIKLKKFDKKEERKEIRKRRKGEKQNKK